LSSFSSFFVAVVNNPPCHDLDLNGPHPFTLVVITVNDLHGCDLDFGGSCPLSFVIVVVGNPPNHGLNIQNPPPFFLLTITTSDSPWS